MLFNISNYELYLQIKSIPNSINKTFQGDFLFATTTNVFFLEVKSMMTKVNQSN